MINKKQIWIARHANHAPISKNARQIQDLGSAPERFSQECSVAIRVMPLHYEAGSRIQ